MGQQRRCTGRAVAAVAVAGLMAVATGCADGGAAADGGGAGDAEDARRAVRGAAAALVGAGSAKASTSMEMDSGGTRVTIRGEGRYDFVGQRGEFEVVLPQNSAAGGRHRPITELLAAGALYMKNRGAGVPADKWVRIETRSLSDGNLVTGGATDPLAAAELLRGARGVRYVGEERVGGVEVRHYRGTAYLPAAAKAASAGQRGALGIAAAKGFSRKGVPFDAWLDDRGRVRKLRQRFTAANGDVASTMLLHGFGAPVRVRLPAEKDIFAGKIAGS
ncbi:Lipoprotein OS=Streptomyces alboniger OX=132473 GN=CP975_16535 PE=4 SV=1 [Streptomyces alboniger]